MKRLSQIWFPTVKANGALRLFSPQWHGVRVKPDWASCCIIKSFSASWFVFTAFSMGFWFLSLLLLTPQASASSSPYSCCLLTWLWKLGCCEETLHTLLLPRVSRLTTGSAIPSATIRAFRGAVPGPAAALQLKDSLEILYSYQRIKDSGTQEEGPVFAPAFRWFQFRTIRFPGMLKEDYALS